MSSPHDRILFCLKSRGPQTAEALARQFDITVPGIRKHLAALLEQELVVFEDHSGSVGRPKRMWKLAPAAESRFPDSHAYLTVELIHSVRELLGEVGLDQLISLREAQAQKRYGEALKDENHLPDKVARLAAIRTEEGYMAEYETLPDGGMLLVENHCPICAAAAACQGFCRSEIELFRHVLGPTITVKRIDHILAGARRCAYRIAPANE